MKCRSKIPHTQFNYCKSSISCLCNSTYLVTFRAEPRNSQNISGVNFLSNVAHYRHPFANN